MSNRLTCLINQRLFTEVNSQTVESVVQSIFEIVEIANCVFDCIFNTESANAASEEEDRSENNCDDADNETCSTDACGLTCSSECLLTANGKNETYDCHRKCEDGEPTAHKAEYETYDTKYEAGCSLTFHDKNSLKFFSKW